MAAETPLSPFARFLMVRGFPFFFVAMGGAFLVFGAWQVYRGVASSSWPSAAGVVRSSALESRLGQKGKSTYRASVRYDYEVEGRRFAGTRVAFGGDWWTSNRSHAQGVVARYPAGCRVTVRYLPSDPEVAVLEPGFRGASWVFPFVGFLVVLLGAVLAVFLPRWIKPRAPGSGGSSPPPPSQP
jgi:hypothetical protein